jgi:putative ABC transport system permease protein
MSIWRLVLCEIGYRKVNFGLALLSVVMATGCVVAVVTLLGIYDAHTEQMVAARQAQTQEEMRRLEDEYRKITKDLGFNLYILHKDQDLNQFHTTQHATRYLPDDCGDQLARAGVVTVNHLLPILHEHVLWPEQGIEVHVIGTRGEIPIAGHDKKKPIRDLVRPGTVVLGFELQKRLKTKRGDSVVFKGHEFEAQKSDTPRGTFEDFTVWMNLADAQKVLGKTGLINIVLALECDCQADRLDKVRAEITKVLPDTQVVEKSVQAEGRARARNQAKATSAAAIEQIRRDREQLREGRTTLAGILVPIVLLASTVWLGGLLFSNVRDRRSEIGILRAVGVSSWSLAVLVLARSLLLALAGASIGYAAGMAIGMGWAEDGSSINLLATALDPVLLVGLFVAAPLWCGLASLMPALLAARQDPALVLSEA